MPRLFVGLELPEAIRERLALVKGPLPGARWIEPEDMHLTLRFIGDIDNPTADELAGFLASIETHPFEVRVTGLGSFGGNDPRTIHAVADGSVALDHLQKAVDRAARSAGIPPEPRSFTPHITLARLKGTPPDVVARFLGSRGRWQPMTFVVDRFTLFSSRPRQGGGPYVVEEAFALGPYSGGGWQPAD